MSHETPVARGVFDPNYWEGYDLHGGQNTLPKRKIWKVNPTQHNKYLRPVLKVVLAEVVAGNHTEIRFGTGKEFSPEAEGIHDGSVVAMDEEELTIWPSSAGYDTSGEPPIAQPYVDYWLNNQPSSRNMGFETDEVEGLTYSRWLAWGVVATDPVYDYSKKPVDITDRRVIMPISFSQVKYDKGKIKVPKWVDTKPWHNALVLPDVIGLVQNTGHRSSNAEDPGDIRSIGRIRSLDLVHLAKASKKRRWSPAIGRVTMIKTAGA